MKLRIAGVLEVIRTAAPTDPRSARFGAGSSPTSSPTSVVIAESLDQKDALRPGLDVDSATDILWSLNISNLWHLLVVERGWTPERFERWLGDLACSQLLARYAAHETGKR